MHRRRVVPGARWSAARTLMALAVPALLLARAGLAPAQPDAGPPTLRLAFEAAWPRQPEAQALALRREAALTRQRSARSWTPEPASLELSARSSGPARRPGLREVELGVAVPLWQPGERSRSQDLAEAEHRAVESRAAAARLRLAAAVREAWWAWQRAQAESDAAEGQLEALRRLAADVARRVSAGDLARADQHQADGAVAAADGARAQAHAARNAARQQLLALTGLPALNDPAALSPEAMGEPLPDPARLAPEPPAASDQVHAELQSLRDRVAVAEGAAALAATQPRASPELMLIATRERGEPNPQSVTLGLRWPLGADARRDAQLAAARADVQELRAQWALEQARLSAERETARARAEAARLQLAAAERRAVLAAETRGFFERSFQLGDTDLPTRLRIEAEAAEAERQLRRARIERAAAVSAWRQALGLLPA